MVKKISLIVSILLLVGGGISVAEVMVIGNSAKLKSLTSGQLKKLYLGRSTSVGKLHIKLTDCKALQTEFLTKYIGKSVKSYNKAWLKKIFAEGLSAPVVFKTEAEVIEYVKKNKGAIGYVSTVPAGVKVILKSGLAEK